MAVPPPPPDLGGNTFIFGADPSKKRRQLFPGKSQSGTSPHSKAQGLSDTASLAAPAATLPSLETGGWEADAENYWWNELSRPKTLPEEMSYAGPMGPYSMMYTPHRKGFWTKISDWWDGEPYQKNPTLPRSTPKQHRPIPGIAPGMTPTMRAPYDPPAKTLQNPAIASAFNNGLPRWERKLIEKQQKAEIKAWKKMEKEQTKLYKQSLKFTTWEERRNLKAMEKELKKNQFNYAHIPHHNSQRPLPQVADHVPERKLEPGNPKKEMLAFMMLPQEEFGVRRPLGGDRAPKGLGGRHDWPMMSRTMTHALTDLGNDEKSTA
ncbi:hypothetical protein C356_03424 [Cryptococcus neoformans c45]|nr:hypothetical protein C356_03424 [Cryptococcus neoformans var. grubii c45]